jgi:hypothetical protein
VRLNVPVASIIHTPWDTSELTRFNDVFKERIEFDPKIDIDNIESSGVVKTISSPAAGSSTSKMFEYVLMYLYTALEEITDILQTVSSKTDAEASEAMMNEIKKNVRESFQNGRLSALAACKCTKDPKTRAVQCDCSSNAGCPSTMINIPAKEYVNIGSFPSLVEICKRK